MGSELVVTLRSQHAGLRTLLVSVHDAARGPAIEGAAILGLLKQFNTALTEHLALEDGTFYPRLLKLMDERGAETSSVVTFIREMGSIAEHVTRFLDGYSTRELIVSSPDAFRAALNTITEDLGHRMAGEDAFVYATYEQLAGQRVLGGELW